MMRRLWLLLLLLCAVPAAADSTREQLECDGKNACAELVSVWEPVFVKKSHDNKELERAFDSIKCHHALGHDPALAFVDHLPVYQASAPITGTLRIWGHGSFKRDFMGRLLDAWIAEFAKSQPNVRFENRMYGTASAIGALYTGAGNLAFWVKKSARLRCAPSAAPRAMTPPE